MIAGPEGEWRCPSCGLRRGKLENVSPETVVSVSQSEPPTCPVDNSVMVPLTWEQAAVEAGIIAGRWMRRAEALENAWPEGHAMPLENEEEF